MLALLGVLVLLRIPSTAVADTALPTCYAGDSLPAPEAEDVPVDVVPVLMASGDGCSVAHWHVTLRMATDDEPLVDVSQDVGADGPLIELFPGGELLPETEYLIEGEGSGFNEQPVLVSFRTGTGTAEVASVVPELSEVQASRLGSSWWLSGRVAGGEELEGTITTLERDGEVLVATTAGGEADIVVEGRVYEAPPLGDFCVTARRRGYAGDWLESEEQCVSVEGCGCNSGGGGGLALVVAASVTAMVRRVPGRRATRGALR